MSPGDGRALAVLVSASRVSASAAGLPPPGDYADDLDLSVLSEDELRATAAALEKAERAARRRRDGDGDDGDGSDGRLN